MVLFKKDQVSLRGEARTLFRKLHIFVNLGLNEVHFNTDLFRHKAKHISTHRKRLDTSIVKWKMKQYFTKGGG